MTKQEQDVGTLTVMKVGTWSVSMEMASTVLGSRYVDVDS